MKINEKTYLGDGLYAVFDGYYFRLTSENGISVLDEVYLEPEVLKAFIEFTKKEFTI
jgi:hypothetical protein